MDRNDEAVEMACSGDDDARVTGLDRLKDLGASATVARLIADGR